LAAGLASALRSEAVGAFGEARVMAWVRRFRQGYAFKTADLCIIGDKNGHESPYPNDAAWIST
jgi:hypothetical protein